MTIYQKLILGFTGIALLVAIVGGAAVTATYGIRYHIDSLLKGNLGEAESTAKIAYNIQRAESAMRELFMEDHVLGEGEWIKKIKYTKSEIRESVSELKKFVEIWEASNKPRPGPAPEEGGEEPPPADEIGNHKELKAKIDSFVKWTDRFQNACEGKELKEALKLFRDKIEPLSRELRASLEYLRKAASRDISKRLGEIKAELARIIAFSFVSLYIALVVAFGLGYLISKKITVSIMKIKDAALELGRGNFGVQAAVMTKDEIGILANTFNGISNTLAELVEREKELSAKIAAAETEHKKAVELERAYTALKETQNQLIQAEKMSAVGQLASGVAHEIRNPLAIIIQGINYIGKKISPGEKDYFEALEMVKDGTKRANHIVETLLDFSKAKELSLQEDDINSVLDRALALVKTQAKFENVEITRQMKDDLPRVMIDRNRMTQVFINLLLNAAQAMPGGGDINIRTYDKQLTEPRNGIGNGKAGPFKPGERVVVVEIEDTGAGISEENLKKIFLPFFTTRGSNGGTGLGLAVSRNIIDMHNGIIDIESKSGKGTKMIVMLKITKG